MSQKKETANLIRKLREQGWRVEETRHGYMAYSPDRVTKVLLHKTPSDHRALKNALSELKRGGFDPNA
jgi:hypothetical protein